MKILLVSPFLPHRALGHGTATVLSHFFDFFAARHEVTVVAFTHDARELPFQEDLASRCRRVCSVPFSAKPMRRAWLKVRALTGGVPFEVGAFGTRPMRDAIAGVLEREHFDVVQFATTQMGQFVNLTQDRATATVLLEIDVVMRPLQRRFEQAAPSLMRHWYRFEWEAMRRYEPALCSQFDLVYAVSEEDQDLLVQARPGLRPLLFRYGVDAEPLDDEPRHEPADATKDPEILFLGSFFHPPNVDGLLWFYQDILPRVRVEMPEVRLRVVGGSPPPEIQELAKDGATTVTGWVADVGIYLRAADVGIAPLRHGGGVKLKTLEMMAAGRAIVTTPVGCEGIRAVNGKEFLVAESAEEFADHLVRLLRDAELRRRLGRAANEFVRLNHQWRGMLEDVEREYARLAASAEDAALRLGNGPPGTTASNG